MAAAPESWKVVINLRIAIYFFLGLAAISAAAVGSGSLYREDAQDLSSGISQYLSVEPLVSFSGNDSALVLFVALGGDWKGTDDQWDQLLITATCAVYLDLLRDWELQDMAVSFGDTWFRIPPDSLMELAGRDLDHQEVMQDFRSMVEVRPLGGESD